MVVIQDSISISGRWYTFRTPEWLTSERFPLLNRVVAGRGECPEGYTNGQAHAHDRGEYRGCICFQLKREWSKVETSSVPTAMFLHEYAHLQTNRTHGKRWQAAYAALLDEWGYLAEYGDAPLGKPSALVGVADFRFWKYSNAPGGLIFHREVE